MTDYTAAGAQISRDGCYRYALWREWSGVGRKVCVIGLNPSTADGETDDRTIGRCVDFAKDWGGLGLLMMNLYAFRATKPPDMLAADDPIGPQCDRWLRYHTRNVDIIVAAWGGDADEARGLEVCKMLNKPLYCLGTTLAGAPRHPLYLKKTTKLEKFWEPDLTNS